MTKHEQRKFILVRARGSVRKVFVDDLKAIIVRKKFISRPRVPTFDACPKMV